MNRKASDIVIKQTDQYEKVSEIAQKTRDYFETGIDQLLKDIRTHRLYGAFIGEEIVGFVTYKKNSDDGIEISWLAVLPDYRDQGIGTTLVNQTLEILKHEYHVCEVKTLAQTHPDPGYARTRNFYTKLGFVSVDILQSYPGWGDNPCQIFKKPLR